MKAIYPIHKNILDREFYSVVISAAKIGDGISNSNGINNNVSNQIDLLNSKSSYIAKLNRKLEKEANEMQKKYGQKSNQL